MPKETSATSHKPGYPDLTSRYGQLLTIFYYGEHGELSFTTKELPIGRISGMLSPIRSWFNLISSKKNQHINSYHQSLSAMREATELHIGIASAELLTQLSKKLNASGDFYQAIIDDITLIDRLFEIPELDHLRSIIWPARSFDSAIFDKKYQWMLTLNADNRFHDHNYLHHCQLHDEEGAKLLYHRNKIIAIQHRPISSDSTLIDIVRKRIVRDAALALNELDFDVRYLDDLICGNGCDKQVLVDALTLIIEKQLCTEAEFNYKQFASCLGSALIEMKTRGEIVLSLSVIDDYTDIEKVIDLAFRKDFPEEITLALQVFLAEFGWKKDSDEPDMKKSLEARLRHNTRNFFIAADAVEKIEGLESLANQLERAQEDTDIRLAEFNAEMEHDVD